MRAQPAGRQVKLEPTGGPVDAPVMRLPSCPYLPPAPAAMDAGALTAHGDARNGAFYLTALTYGQYLWQQGLVARAILKLNRGFGADLKGGDPVLRDWPLPYRALGWILRHTPDGVFLGNPRVHFQHLADRMNEPRREQRRWRAWACWALARAVRPELAGDPEHEVQEPAIEQIANRLDAYSLPGETGLWLAALSARGE
jgi:hypothetical protein